jgi:hypothetical protein
MLKDGSEGAREARFQLEAAEQRRSEDCQHIPILFVSTPSSLYDDNVLITIDGCFK